MEEMGWYYNDNRHWYEYGSQVSGFQILLSFRSGSIRFRYMNLFNTADPDTA
uniref:WWE domain-containing protein n=1 Tax=Anguilla anguilla TaxID=7936 RepID=A0A0E9VJG2_ANGAN